MATTVQQLVINMKVTGASQAKQTIQNALGGGSGGSGASGGSGGGSGSASNGGSMINSMGILFQVRYAVTAVVHAFSAMTRAAEQMSSEILNIRDALGSTFGQASGMNSLFHAAGMSGSTGTKMAERLGSDVVSPNARAAMNILGVGVSPGESGTKIFGDVIKGLQGITDGTRKAQLAIKIFGEDGYKEMLPILRMSKDIYDESQMIAGSLSESDLLKWEHFKEKVANLGNAFISELAMPLLIAIIPAIELVTTTLITLFSAFDNINNAFGGLLAYGIAFAGLAAGLTAIVLIFVKLWEVLKDIAVVKAIIAALDGNYAGIAMATAIGAGIGIGLGTLNSGDSKLGEIADNTKRSADALMDMTASTIGGAGRVGNIVLGNMQVEYTLHNAMRLR